MTTDTVTASPPSWRVLYPPHPYADVFPMLPEDELDKLGADILTRVGLTQSIALWRDPTTGQTWLLDGRNRLEALERVGAKLLPDQTVVLPGGQPIRIVSMKNAVTDVAAYVIAANIHRRHLTKEQRAELIYKAVEAGRTAKEKATVTTNDGANMARSFSPTPGQKGGSTKDPVLSAAVEEAQKHGISKRTVKRARAKLQGKKPAPTTKTKRIGVSPTPPPSEARPLAATRTRATVVKSSDSPAAFNIVAMAERAMAAVQTEWKACPKQHREQFVIVCYRWFQEFARTHNANLVNVPKNAKRTGGSKNGGSNHE